MVDSTPLNPLRARLNAGEIALGLLVSMPGVATTQIFASVDLDWLFIDMEHGPIDIESLHAMIAATNGTGTAPIVRVPWNEHWLVKPVLDAGAMGVVFPMIRSAEEARAAVASVRYPPTGERGFSPIYAALRFGTGFGDHVDVADREIVCNLLIEHRDAIEDIERIVEVPGVDVCQIAPYDLALSYGYRDGPDHPEVHEAMARAEAAILASPARLGRRGETAEAAQALIARGYTVILGGIDALMLQGAARAVVEGVRGAG
jgi:4-hydroxy-2-oxoheptanedioate aldolase